MDVKLNLTSKVK